MKMKIFKRVLPWLLAVISSTAFGSTNLSNNNADIVYVKSQCGATSDCAESMYDLITWLWNTRHPSTTNPVLVNIGPGTFPIINPSTGYGIRLCNGGGHVTFRGAGRENTAIVGPGTGYPIGSLTTESAVVNIKNCSQLSFENMTIRAELTEYNASYAVGWIDGGSSTWTNVELVASYYPWVDKCTASGSPGTHRWFGSTFVSHGTGVFNVAFRSDCGDSEIYGSNLFSTKTALGNTSWTMVGVEAGSQGRVEIYGSSVKVIVPANADPNIVFSNQSPSGSIPTYGQGGLLAIDGGIIHMHGGIISVRHERDDADSSVFGARTDGTASVIHTPDTAYGMKAGGNGVIARIMTSGGIVMAPFQWPQGDTPPDITSENGADMFVETDCSISGVCDNVPTNEQIPHMMIYNANCSTGGRWFDTSMNQCRQ